MSAKYVITPDGLEQAHQRKSTAGPFMRGLAHLITYIFHPVFVPLYVLALLLFAEPFLFAGAPVREKIITLGRAFVNYTFFPLISVFLLKALGLISSVRLKDRKDRIIPFIICNIWYFWIWYVWRNLPGVPRELLLFAMSVFLASAIGLLFNIYFKISMHGIAMATATVFICWLTLRAASPNITLYLMLSLFATGLVGSSRLLLAEHTPQQYYWSLAAGTLAVCIAALFYH